MPNGSHEGDTTDYDTRFKAEDALKRIATLEFRVGELIAHYHTLETRQNDLEERSYEAFKHYDERLKVLEAFHHWSSTQVYQGFDERLGQLEHSLAKLQPEHPTTQLPPTSQ